MLPKRRKRPTSAKDSATPGKETSSSSDDDQPIARSVKRRSTATPPLPHHPLKVQAVRAAGPIPTEEATPAAQEGGTSSDDDDVLLRPPQRLRGRTSVTPPCSAALLPGSGVPSSREPSGQPQASLSPLPEAATEDASDSCKAESGAVLDDTEAQEVVPLRLLASETPQATPEEESGSFIFGEGLSEPRKPLAAREKHPVAEQRTQQEAGEALTKKTDGALEAHLVGYMAEGRQSVSQFPCEAGEPVLREELLGTAPPSELQKPERKAEEPSAPVESCTLDGAKSRALSPPREEGDGQPEDPAARGEDGGGESSATEFGELLVQATSWADSEQGGADVKDLGREGCPDNQAQQAFGTEIQIPSESTPLEEQAGGIAPEVTAIQPPQSWLLICQAGDNTSPTPGPVSGLDGQSLSSEGVTVGELIDAVHQESIIPDSEEDE
jgi:hypothetical protein